MKPSVFLFIFAVVVPLISGTRFLQLFDTLEAESSNPNGFHKGESTIPLPVPSILDYRGTESNDTFSFKQIPDEVPRLSVIIPKNDDYMKNSFAEKTVDLSSLENQAENLVEDNDTSENNAEMGVALQKTRDFIEKALEKDLDVGVSKDDLMNLLSFSKKILDKCNGDYLNCHIEKKNNDQEVQSEAPGDDDSKKGESKDQQNEAENKVENKEASPQLDDSKDKPLPEEGKDQPTPDQSKEQPAPEPSKDQPKPEDPKPNEQPKPEENKDENLEEIKENEQKSRKKSGKKHHHKS